MELKNLDSNSMVAILLCTYNGDNFLRSQLQSIENQTYKNWFVIASDDGSSDSTVRILDEYQARWSKEKIVIRNGPQKGCASNFLFLACDETIIAKYYAFCDQDDVWDERKLEVAVKNILSNEVHSQPYLYCCRTNYVLDDLSPHGKSPLKKYRATFENALVENIAGGNTMVFNRAAKKILEIIGVKKITSHDWWLYLVVTGVRGSVYYDPIPWVQYRQHKNSLIGSGYQIKSRIKKIFEVYRGSLKAGYTLNIDALIPHKRMLDKEKLNILMDFSRVRSENFWNRLSLARKNKFFKQSPLENFGFWIALMLKKI